MANNPSAEKRMRQNAARRLRNRYYKKSLRSAIKKLRNTQDKDEAQKLYKEVSGMLDRLANKNMIHKNQAANKKSSLSKHVASL